MKAHGQNELPWVYTTKVIIAGLGTIPIWSVRRRECIGDDSLDDNRSADACDPVANQ